MCHTAWLLLLWTMFQAPFLPIIPFPLAKLNWNTFCRLKNTVKTLWIPCAAVWQPTNAGVLLQTQRGASQQTCRPTKTESCLNTYFHWEGGKGSPAHFNQDLKTGEPLIKEAALYIYLIPLEALLACVSRFDPAPVKRGVRPISAADNTLVKLWCRKRNIQEPLTLPSPLTATSKCACVVCCTSCVWFFFSPCWETVPLIFRALSQTSPPGYKGAVTGRCPTTCEDSLYLIWICSWWWGQTLQQASWQMSCLNASE